LKNAVEVLELLVEEYQVDGKSLPKPKTIAKKPAICLNRDLRRSPFSSIRVHLRSKKERKAQLSLFMNRRSSSSLENFNGMINYTCKFSIDSPHKKWYAV